MRRKSTTSKGGKTFIPWDILIPATFLAASVACYRDPSLAPAITFFFIGFGMIFFESVAMYFTTPASEGLSKAFTNSMLAFANEENHERTDMLLDAMASSISRALQSSTLMGTLKKSILDAVKDDELQTATIQTLQSAMKKAADNQEFKQTVFEIIKSAFVGALQDDAFVHESAQSAVAAMVTASQDDALRQSVLAVVTQGVSDALNDEEFIDEIRGVIKDSLSDGELYRSGARGMYNAAFGRRAKDSESGSKKSVKQLTEEKL